MKRCLWMTVCAVLLVIVSGVRASGADLAVTREQAKKLKADGNFKEALALYRGLALDAANDPQAVVLDIDDAAQCMKRLNLVAELDAFLEDVVKVQAGQWRALTAVAQLYFDAQHQGAVIAGKFTRGWQRGGAARYVNSVERDRVRALQLMVRAMAEREKRIQNPEARSQNGEKGSSAVESLKSGGGKDDGLGGAFYEQFARILIGSRGFNDSWRLQYLSDLAVLPDYEDGYSYYHGGWGGETRGAPVDEDGKPIYYRVPGAWGDAANDGERWRWCLERAVACDRSRRGSVKSQFAQFLQNQFDVQTLANQGWFARGMDEDRGAAGDSGYHTGDQEEKAESGTYALHTLKENETIARLATGIKRFTLPDEFNFIRIYQELAQDKETAGYAEASLNILAECFTNRRQYERAAGYWRENIDRFGPGGPERTKEKRLEQIVGNWGRFEPVASQPAGKAASVEYRFRNGRRVAFDAREINVKQLLDDVKAYLKSNPKELTYDRINIGNIGYMLVEKEQRKYAGKEVARWDLSLEPRDRHFDRVVTVQTPLQKAGAYLLTATMDDGNVSTMILWVSDTVIARKQMDKGAWFFLADAVSGKPVPNATLEFFGYRQNYLQEWKRLGRHYDVLTTAFAESTDAEGQAVPPAKEFQPDYQWMITATTEDGRLAYLGFTHGWGGDYHDSEYKERKVFGITDRPVYRPDQAVKFKFWVRKAQYDQEDLSDFAGQEFAVIVTNPQGEKVFEKTFKSDAFAGLSGEFGLKKDAALGSYYAYVWKEGKSWGGMSFRVEEYKKPEFEVTVEAPTEPVKLGETLSATIRAKYYFGAPVKEAKVKVKVMRTSHETIWYPPMPWDWFYGPGYWWFASDYPWYPGWLKWGCFCPRPPWWSGRSAPPELVSDMEAPIGADGTLKVTIDTSLAKELHGDSDHQYQITAEVVDASRRTIVGQGTVLVTRRPFKVYAWVNRGHYRPGDVVQADFNARTPDGKPVQGSGELVLYRIRYKHEKPEEKAVQRWTLDTDADGQARQLIKASEAGQYRLSYTVTDAKRREVEGGYVFVVRGEGDDGHEFKFSEIELTPERREYAPGEKVRLLVSTDHPGATVLLFVRPANGVYLKPKVIKFRGKQEVEEIEVSKKDMPNFHVEALTVFDGKVYTQSREIVVPPEKRILNIEVLPSAMSYKPGEEATVRMKVTDFYGKPYAGSVVVSVYDKSVEYISGGSNIQEIKAFFWKWRRHHQPWTESNVGRQFYNMTLPKAVPMSNLGLFGEGVVDELGYGQDRLRNGFGRRGVARKASLAARSFTGLGGGVEFEAMAPAPMAAMAMDMDGVDKREEAKAWGGGDVGGEQGEVVAPAVRKDFADTAYWNASLVADADGVVEVRFKMPENLTGWAIKAWVMGHGTKVGEGSAAVVTAKNLLLRLQAPRFFVEKDEVVLSANIHNYLKTTKSVRAELELEGGCLEFIDPTSRTVKIEAGGEARVDWRVKAVREGRAVVRMKALTNEESDAMEMDFPVYVHGMLKMDSFCGVIRRDADGASFTMTVPAQRRPEQTRLEVRYSPTLAGAMVDALPYLVDYPYGCTEQTLNRFLPTVLVQKVLKDMGLDLKAIRDKQTNLNAQEIGDAKERAAQWKRGNPPNPGETRNPVFDEAVVLDMVRQGLKALTAMQLDDGGWGWFSGWGEQSWPHTTAYVVHGLQMAKKNGVAVVPSVMERGVQWLANYRDEQIRRLRNAATKTEPWKEKADDLDAFVQMVLVDAGKDSAELRDYLYRDRTSLSVYAKAMFGLSLHATQQVEKRDMLVRNIRQYLVRDEENQTAYLKLGNEGYWWCWYGSENEAHAYTLKLLSVVDPKGDEAADLVKYLLNNRRHATYWNSTRDTALCIEAMADYLKASGEDRPDMTVQVLVDGVLKKRERITTDRLFLFDNVVVLEGAALTDGAHKVDIVREGTGPVYFNAYLSNFTLEDDIKRAGLEVKVNRKIYKLTPVDKKVKVAGSRGQALDQKVEKYKRTELESRDVLKSGDLVEVELEIDSKNDYEYLVFEDMKAAGFEPVEVRSGYTDNDMRAYVEFRDERVCFFARTLARGKHSVAYRLKAEIPGMFSALPTRAHAMYAPELKANSDEIKLGIKD